MHYRRAILLTVAASAAVTLSSPALAQDLADRPESSETPLDNIVVTASLSPLARVNIGSSMTVIDREQIERRQSRYVTDLLRTVPGFSVSQSGTTGSQTQVRVRGSEANHVLVLIDGVRANDPATGDEFRWEYLSTANVERIEIVRGPQSSLWGSDAVAAVVHVITRSGGSATQLGGFAEGGSNNTLNAGLQGGTGGDSWSLSYGLERLGTDGTNVSRSGDEDDDSHLTTGSLSGQFEASDALSFNLGVRAVDAYSQFDPVDFALTGLPADGDVATDSEQVFAQAGLTYSLRDGRWLNHVNVRYMDTDNRNLTDGIEDSSSTSDRTTVSYQADFKFSENILSLAAQRERTNFSQRGAAIFGDPNQDQDMSVNSLIADFQGRSTAPVTWLLSARYDDNSDFDNAVTGRLSLAWELTESFRLKGNIGSGQKSPTFTELFGFFPGQFQGNPDLKPEKSKSLDLGFAVGLMNGALHVELTVFNEVLTDEIDGFAFDPDTFLFTAVNRSGDSTRRGAELAANLAVTNNLSLMASYTYTDSEEEDASGNMVEELRRPRHIGSVSGNYRLLQDKANVLLVADYGGTSKDTFFPPFPEPAETVTLANYWLVDLTAGYDVTTNVNVFARLTNLLDEDYEQVYGYATPGRAGYVGVRVNFGD